MRFAFIARHRHVWPVSWLCEVLEVSRSGFHAEARKTTHPGCSDFQNHLSRPTGHGARSPGTWGTLLSEKKDVG